MFKFIDKLMIPLMYLFSGTLIDSPQSTHRWNSQKLKENELDFLDHRLVVLSKGEANAMKERFVFLYHIPILGGWRDYLVLNINNSGGWYLG